jgi:hypothetical protein
MKRGSSGLQRNLHPERRPRRSQAEEDADRQQDGLHDVIAVGDRQHRGHDQPRQCDPDPQQASPAAPEQPVPARGQSDHHAGEHDQAPRELHNDDVGSEQDDRRRQDDGDDRRHALTR